MVKILAGQKVQLRAATEADFPLLAQWWEDPALVGFQHVEFRPEPYENTIQKFRIWSANKTPGTVGFAVDVAGELVGHVTLYDLSLPARIATYSIMLGPDYHGRGYGTDATRVALRYAFEQMGANKVELTAHKHNTRAQATYRKCGFIVEGIRRAAIWHEGQWQDEVLMGILLEDWRSHHRVIR